MVGIQIGKEQEERKRQEEGLNFETTPWWNFRNHHGLCGRRAAEREFVKFVKLRAQPTAKAKAIISPSRYPRSGPNATSKLKRTKISNTSDWKC